MTEKTTESRTDEPIQDGSRPSGSRNCYPFPDPVTVELTAEERDFLACLLYQVVGGPARGLRKIGERIAVKLQPSNVKRFEATIENVNRFGGIAVVVRNPK